MTATSDITDFRIETPDGATLHAFKEGHGQPLLLVSGLSGSAAFWSEIAATLSRSFQVIRFDQRGIGASTRGEATASQNCGQLMVKVLRTSAESGISTIRLR